MGTGQTELVGISKTLGTERTGWTELVGISKTQMFWSLDSDRTELGLNSDSDRTELGLLGIRSESDESDQTPIRLVGECKVLKFLYKISETLSNATGDT